MDSDLGNKEILALNVRRHLDYRGMTMKDLAVAIDVPASTVQNWCSAQSYPRIDKIEKMARFFGCEKSDLTEEPATARAVLLQKLFRTQPGLKELFEEARGMSEEDLRFATAILRAIRIEKQRGQKKK